MEKPPQDNSSSRPATRPLPLLFGVVLVVLGVLLLASDFFGWNLHVAPVRSVLPLLLVILGGSSVYRYFSNDFEEVGSGRRRSGGLILGSFLAFLGIFWLGQGQGWFGGLQFAARFWPLLLVVIGIGKVYDFYRLRGRARLQVRELIGILLIILLGWLAGRASRWEFLGPDFPFRIHGYDVRVGESFGKSFSAAAAQSFEGHWKKRSIPLAGLSVARLPPGLPAS